MEQKEKRWFRNCIAFLLGTIVLYVVVVWMVDPYFHFHKPFPFISYRLYEERYINDGISRHFDYDTIITGTSMAQNFKPSEVDALFGTKCVKETFSGAGYQEISQNLERALRRNENLKTVFWTMDYNAIIRPYDWVAYEDYPTYLYDDNIWNDIRYLFNKDVLYHGVMNNLFMTITGKASTTMDAYSAWEKETGLSYILQSYDRHNLSDELPSLLSEEEAQMVCENVKKNMIDLINQHPDTTFYIFYTPYSICYWDSLSQAGALDRQFQAEQIATELLLECPNVRLFNFFDQYDIITDTNHYRDKEHYASWINSQILTWMSEDVGLVTKENYQEKLKNEKEFYGNFDYNSIYE